MAHILVTGGAGYIGSVLVPRLLVAGHQVTVLDTFQHGLPYLADCCIDPRFTPIRGDCRDMREIEPLLAEADIIIPMAALVGAPLCDADKFAAQTTNRDAVCDLMRRVSPLSQLVIFPTSNSGYGIGDQAECTEDSPLRPVSIYGRTKVSAEASVLQHERAVSLRLATVFGMSPRMRLDLLVNDFTWRAVHDRSVVLFEGHFRRNYVHVSDVAGAFVQAINLGSEGKMRGPYNVGDTAANKTKRQLCDLIVEEVPGFVALAAAIGTDPDQRDYAVSNARMEATGWWANVSLRMGIREMVKGFRMMRANRFGNV